MKLEQVIEETRQEYRIAATALKQPFKHADVLQKARWDVERIGWEMRGEGNSQPTFDAELEAMQKSQRANSPVPAGTQNKTPATDISVASPRRGPSTVQRDEMER